MRIARWGSPGKGIVTVWNLSLSRPLTILSMDAKNAPPAGAALVSRRNCVDVRRAGPLSPAPGVLPSIHFVVLFLFSR
jgi:hypothetical protein